ncbi:hypothetical protein NP493_2194g00015 [Ridgeia piscesae]|uniref:Uncharacterized protein n=1 Tax=Ridgeia piscesae TaxID=27915 RepID=A0AAD9JKY1_RIDPI|nr:hypothetical protein NP493_2194g00015 [Ridgeia piscesae]
MRAYVILFFAVLALACVAAHEIDDETDEAAGDGRVKRHVLKEPAPREGCRKICRRGCCCYSWGSVHCKYTKTGCLLQRERIWRRMPG